MIWPANAPDMNRIEQMQNYLARAISDRNDPLANLENVTVAVQEEYDNMHDTFIKSVIRGMSRRVEQLTERRGNHTEY